MRTATIAFNKEITIMENLPNDNVLISNIKYRDIDQVAGFDEFIMTVATGMKDRRIKQVESLGFTIKEICWIGETKTSNTRIIFTKQPEEIEINIDDLLEDNLEIA